MPILSLMFKKPIMIALALCLLSMPVCGSVRAGDTAEGKGGVQLPVPRFVSLGTDEVNLRAGPGLRYPIRLVIKKDGLPVEVIREFDVWRQIRDMEGDEGWVHKSMLSGKRTVLVKGTMRTILKKPDEGKKPVARLEPGVVATLKSCEQAWCEVSVSGYGGWLKRSEVWGVYPDEKFGGG